MRNYYYRTALAIFPNQKHWPNGLSSFIVLKS